MHVATCSSSDRISLPRGPDDESILQTGLRLLPLPPALRPPVPDRPASSASFESPALPRLALSLRGSGRRDCALWAVVERLELKVLFESVPPNQIAPLVESPCADLDRISDLVS